MKKLLILVLVVGLALLALGLYLVFKKNPINEPKVLAEGTIPVNTQWTSVGTFNGKIYVSMSGRAKLDSTRPELTPEGISSPAPQFFTYPGDNAFCSLAKHDGLIEKIGNGKDINVHGELFLGPNEDFNKKDGLGLDDNIGVWSYKITGDASSTPLVVKIEPNDYINASWDSYGPGHEGDPLNSAQVWMSAVGSISYKFSAPKSDAILRVRLSSELLPNLQGKVNGNPDYSTDVDLVVNDAELQTQNVIADDQKGTEYAWKLSSLKRDNTLKFEVKPSAKHKNGLTIYGPIQVQFK